MKPISRRRAAARIGIAASTLAALEAKGIAPKHVRIGNVTRYTPEVLDEYLAAHTIEGTK